MECFAIRKKFHVVRIDEWFCIQASVKQKKIDLLSVIQNGVSAVRGAGVLKVQNVLYILAVEIHHFSWLEG